MKKLILGTVLAAVFSVLPTKAYGQFGVEDWLSIEAGIYTHKKAGSKVLFRQAQEGLNTVLMGEVKTSSGKYKKIHEALDKYYQAFNWVQLSLNALASGVQIYTDVSAIGNDVVKLADLLIDFTNYCEEHGINVNECLGVYASFNEYGNIIVSDCEEVYDIALGFAQPILTKSATTQQVLLGVTSIAEAVHKARKDIDRLYRSLYNIIMLRRGYWNPNWGHFMVHNKRVYTNVALDRWHQAMSRNLEKVKGDR